MPTRKEIEELLRQSQRLKDESVIRLGKRLGSVQNRIFRIVVSEIAKLSFSGGSVKLTATNASKIQRIINKVERSIFSGRYLDDIDAYLASFQDLEGATIANHSVINGIKVTKGSLKNLRAEFLEETLSQIKGTGFKAGFLDELKSRIARNVIAGSNRLDIRDELENFILGNEERLGGLTRHVNQISTDLINQYDGAMNQLIGNEFGLNWIVYAGRLIATSRPQCIRWVGKRYLHRDQLDEEIMYANNNGSGMIPGTTVSNFSVNRGGFNCLHQAIWVSDEVVPKNVRLQQAKTAEKV